MTAPVRVGVRGGNDPVLWRLIDDIGFDHIWTDDHLIAMRTELAPVLDSWTELAAMAIATKRVRVGVLVTSVMYRHPSVLAKQAVTVDQLSGGRLEVGMGAGWNEPVFKALGIPFAPVAERMDRLDEACSVMRALWSEPRATFRGKYYELTDAIAEPKPVQRPHPPLWIGGNGPKRTLRIVARHADVWSASAGDLDEDLKGLRTLEAHCADIDRDPADIRRSVEFNWPDDASDATLSAIERYVKAGFTEICFGMVRGEAIKGMTLEDARRRIERFARGALPHIRQMG
jgi:F420-dependent oxidoreductase-like protein